MIIACDIDGTFMNTMPATYSAYAQALREHGFDLSWWAFDVFVWSSSWEEAWPRFLDEDTARSVHARKNELFAQQVLPEPNKALCDCLTNLAAMGHQVVFTTAGSVEATARKLDGLDPLWAGTRRVCSMKKKDPACWDVFKDDVHVIDDNYEVLLAARQNKRVTQTTHWKSPLLVLGPVTNLNETWEWMFKQKNPHFKLYPGGFLQSDNGYGYAIGSSYIYKGEL